MTFNWADMWWFFTFQVLPYAVIVLLVLGSILRWMLAPYSWKSQSSEILGSKTSLGWGANLFHIGVIGLFFGHLFGLFTPEWVLNGIGLTPPVHQLTEVILGGICGTMALVGIVILFFRRCCNERVRTCSRASDFWVLVFLIAVLCLGMSCLIYGFFEDKSGAKLVVMGNWAKALMTFQPDAWTIMRDGGPVLNMIHIIFGLIIFLMVPFTRLVHIWSGYLSPTYLTRAIQIMRRNEGRLE